MISKYSDIQELKHSRDELDAKLSHLQENRRTLRKLTTATVILEMIVVVSGVYLAWYNFRLDRNILGYIASVLAGVNMGLLVRNLEWLRNDARAWPKLEARHISLMKEIDEIINEEENRHDGGNDECT